MAQLPIIVIAINRYTSRSGFWPCDLENIRYSNPKLTTAKIPLVTQ
ncbi:hypothetical protein HYX14_03030 [Candidatus Woesearchaeota archaeon]|nr:hypothetical protein [Candidatus Woesearchaeota archaeon]